MSTNDLNTPVQGRSAGHRLVGLFSSPLAIVSGVFAGAVTVLFAWLVVADNPLGGEPLVIVAINQSQTADAADYTGSGLGMRNTVNPEDNVDISTQTPSTDNQTSEPLDEQFDELYAGQNTISKVLPTAPVKGMAEQGAHGLLPQISAKGETPAKVYARPVTTRQADPNTAKIAIMIGGMGLSAFGTSVAVNRLPENITLAFAPYAKGLQSWVNKARQNGHEVMLQLPMEPFDYPDNDPGPHTLLSSLPPPDNVRRLEWLLSRFTGYFGVTNYMGAKFTSSSDALRPVLRQLNRRGLVFVEDGSSARSNVKKISRQVGLKSTSADLIIDNNPNGPSIDEALKQLENLALERGIAVGVGSGLPITVERIIKWAEHLKKRGILLVPVSATISLRKTVS